jgi:hypothetical protein
VDSNSPFVTTRETIPIIGEPFKLHGGHPVVLISCGCEAKSPLLLQGVAPNICPACRRGFQIQSFTFNPNAPQAVQVNIGVGVATSTTPAKAGS